MRHDKTHEVASKPSVGKSAPLFSRPRFVHNRVLTWTHVFPSILVLIAIAVLPSCAHVNGKTLVKRARSAAQRGLKNTIEAPVLAKAASKVLGEDEADAKAPSVVQAKKRDELVRSLFAGPSDDTAQSEADETKLALAVDSGKGLATSKDAIETASHQDARIPPAPFPTDDTPMEIAGIDGQTLSLNDLEQIAMTSNPTLAQMYAVVSKARGIHCQVGLYPNPIVGYSGTEIGNEGHAGQQGAFISQTIVTGDKLQLNRNVAAQSIQGLSWDLEAQRYRVRNDIRLKFYETLGAQRRVQLAQKLKKVAEEGVGAAELRFNAKQSALPDVLQAKVQLNEVQIVLQNAEIEYDAAWKQLASVVGRPDLVARLDGSLENDADVLTWESSYQQLLSSSPELQAAYVRAKRARLMIQRQEAQPIPNLLTQVGVAHDYSTGDAITNVQVGIPLPLFNKNEGNIDFARAEYHRAVRDSKRMEFALRSRLASVFGDYEKSRQQVDRYRNDILPISDKNLELTNDGYRQSEFDFLRVLTARRTYFETNLAYVRSLTDLRQAEVKITGLLLTGGLDQVSDIAAGAGGVGTRGQALSGQ